MKKYLYNGEMFWRRFGYPLAGVDEAGRGPLAGPVVAAAVILPKNLSTEIFSGLADGKTISASRRLKLYSEIIRIAPAVSWAVVSPAVIDRINILSATLLAMRRAVERLKIKPNLVLVDGNKSIPRLEVSQVALVDADAKIPAVVCAGIVAKVIRDDLMKKYHQIFPEYNFIQHKGYGTRQHYQLLRRYGLCPIHRRSFCNVPGTGKIV